MDFGIADAVLVDHEDGHVVPRGGDVKVAEEIRAAGDRAGDGIEQTFAGSDVAADAAHVSLDDAQCRGHDSLLLG
jgi:hypothetical protein